MFALICSKAVALALGFAPTGPLERFRQLPTPAEVQQEIIGRLLTNYRKSLDSTVKGRKSLEKQLEETTDPQVQAWRADLIVEVKKSEADLRRRIERLERGKLTPPVPVMPLTPSEHVKPKLPIRD